METQVQAQSKPSLHPLAWAAGVAVIVFSAAGVGAMMGWLPTSTGSPAEKPAQVALQTTTAPAPAGVTGHPAGPVAAKPHQAPQRTPAPVHVAAACLQCGVIESVREVDAKGEGSGLGAVGGAVVGGLLGSQVGGGRGKDVMMVAGAVGGGLAGNEIEKRVKTSKSYSITVRLEDGSTRVVNQATAPAWRAGDKVKFVDGVIQSNA
jgi:outer membrane lipoprotein SlyB